MDSAQNDQTLKGEGKEHGGNWKKIASLEKEGEPSSLRESNEISLPRISNIVDDMPIAFKTRLVTTKPPRTASSQTQFPKKSVSRTEKRNADIDSILVTIEKWITNTRKWTHDPLAAYNYEKLEHSPLIFSKSLDPYFQLEKASYNYKGEKDLIGRPHGQGVIRFANGDKFFGEFKYGLRHGPGTLQINNEISMLYLDGHYYNDMLEGKGKIQFRDGDTFFAHFSKGIACGIGKLFDRHHRLKSLAWYQNGKPIGVMWKFLQGGSCITGEVDSITGVLMGDEIAFLFPDYKSALVGTFANDRFAFAQLCFPQGVTIKRHICHLKFTKPRGAVYSYDPSTTIRISSEPLLKDPYETEYCYVRRSKIRGAKDGLFARSNLPKDFVVSFYNGVKCKR